MLSLGCTSFGARSYKDNQPLTSSRAREAKHLTAGLIKSKKAKARKLSKLSKTEQNRLARLEVMLGRDALWLEGTLKFRFTVRS